MNKVSKISIHTKKLLKEDIVGILYEMYPHSLFTNQVAEQLRRNNEFTLKLLEEMRKQNLVSVIKKTKKGEEFVRRKRWKLPSKVVEAMR